MAQLPCISLSWPLTKLSFGSCAIYFHYGVNTIKVTILQLSLKKFSGVPNSAQASIGQIYKGHLSVDHLTVNQ